MFDALDPRNYDYLCAPCADALGGVWPEGHRATVFHDKCWRCNTRRPLACWSDWDWTANEQAAAVAKVVREV